MKIIRQSIPEKVYRMECSGCHAVFEFKGGELEFIYDQRDGDYAKFSCPCCRKGITLAHSALPRYEHVEPR